MPKAKTGDIVKVHYTGKFEDGTIFDTTIGDEPLEFTIGTGMVIPGFEKAVTGMEINEEKEVVITSDEAFGSYKTELSFEVNKNELQGENDPVIGQKFEMDKDNDVLLLQVVDVLEKTVILDGNHPLAGYDLIFEIKLVEIS